LPSGSGARKGQWREGQGDCYPTEGADLAEKLTATFAGDDIRIPCDKRIFDALIAWDAAGRIRHDRFVQRLNVSLDEWQQDGENDGGSCSWENAHFRPSRQAGKT
jgi:hypothetical protein